MPAVPAEKPPSGPSWLHEIKHDGFRLMARRDGAGVRLLTRISHDWKQRFPLIRGAVEALRVHSCLIDSEAMAFEANGLASFELLLGRRHDRQVTLCAVDLVELDGRDPPPRAARTAQGVATRPARAPAAAGLVLNAVFEEPVDVMFKLACALGCEGIVSKRSARAMRADARELAQIFKESGGAGSAAGGGRPNAKPKLPANAKLLITAGPPIWRRG